LVSGSQDYIRKLQAGIQTSKPGGLHQQKNKPTHEPIAKTPEADQPPPGTEAQKKKEKMPE
jgi:hypothetical protein